jgi:phosphoribosyl-AMP cyclohydrolase
LWMKGEESGNIQLVREILVDCDSDALIYLVDSIYPACHTGKRTCFHNKLVV